MIVIGYTRVSTREQANEGNGLAAQRKKILEAATFRGWDVMWVEDAGHSGKNVNRPGLVAALAMLQRHHADGLVVAKLDRLSRSVPDFGKLLDTAHRQGWTLTALDVDVDTSTPTGEMVANILMSVAQWERKIIGARTKDALAEVRAKGVRLGSPVLIPADVQQRILAERAAGKSYGRIADGLNEDGVPCAGKKRGVRWYGSTVGAVCKRQAIQGIPA